MDYKIENGKILSMFATCLKQKYFGFMNFHQNCRKFKIKQHFNCGERLGELQRIKVKVCVRIEGWK